MADFSLVNPFFWWLSGYYGGYFAGYNQQYGAGEYRDDSHERYWQSFAPDYFI